MEKLNRKIVGFIGIGAQKAGTTWLHAMLVQHPDVFIPKQKELCYFNRLFSRPPRQENINYRKSIKWYLSFFKDSKPGQLLGEITPCYLYNDNTARDIYNYNPNMKIVAIIRHPVDRAFSQFRFEKQHGHISSKETFDNAIIRNNEYFARGLYNKQLQQYWDTFPHDQVKVIVFDDFKKNPAQTLKEVETFLGIKEFVPENTQAAVNPTGAPKYPWLSRSLQVIRHALRSFVRKHNQRWIYRAVQLLKLPELHHWITQSAVDYSKAKEKLSDKQRTQHISFFKSDIYQLEQKLDRKLW